MKQLSISTKLTNRDNDSLRQYFKEINSYPKFTPQEEAECASKAVLR
jgi:DNA-directed RNA polymerase sigma subunit (sigma70/sigma32)